MNTLRIIFIILILQIFQSLNYAQSNFNIGFRDDLGIINYKIGDIEKTEFLIYPIQNLYFTLDLKLNNENSVQIRPGYIIAKNAFNGWQLGGFWIYNFINLNIYSSLGYNFHFNNDVAGGNSGGTGNTISLLALGIGYKTTEIMSLEISYQYPLKNNYGFFVYKGEYLDHKILSIIKLGVIFKITRN